MTAADSAEDWARYRHADGVPVESFDGHAAGDGGFTYRMVHIGPEFFASLTGIARPRSVTAPSAGSPVMEERDHQ
jgi:hypothetical protein